MLNSLFFVNTSGDVLLEKHWKSVIHRSICDYFFDIQKKVSNENTRRLNMYYFSQSHQPEDVPPIISTPHHYLINVYQNNLYLVAVITVETPPLMVIEFLHRVITTFAQYFDEFSDSSIKENCVMVFELLDEMLDNGFPLVTEMNILQDLIKPPNFLRNIANQVTGRTNLSETLPTGQLSNIPWRRQGVKYTNNEAYFDVIEEIDVIVDKQGSTVFAEIQGYVSIDVDVCCKLSGMPDLTMTLINPRLLDDVSFHPCVRYKRWENEKVLSFVPPDGNFRLLSYHIAAQNMVAIPIYVRQVISLKPNAGKLDLTVGPKLSMGKVLEDVVLEITMPKCVQNCNLVASHGKIAFDPTTKLMQWTIGKIEVGKPSTLKGSIAVSGTVVPESPSISLKFKINQLVLSGLKVNRLDMYGEKYKPFKGVKYITKAGKFTIRT
ncbi:CRE-APM-3 protein [Caenorhabditis remanei]|uniref:CRE-APM-3 protein n=1 Tax=Caenorhabditis remanei TaxID=31234 RepID=E3MA35_CAERE|nr:CRE-APM-3 protein [Caenorhabditis remanei]